ncbi:MAG: helix-turn-helix domain-containing protein [Gordonia sp. (in: high G+C Gram-positive bacteria)]|uniref:PucR family transcriptional regulator n=1 Tax=Gordonia sp. (in: high G+C Gram-positive bacteria) TaxID=84139 RepID=UPI0039E3168C
MTAAARPTGETQIRLVDHLAQRTAAVVADTVRQICSEVDFYRSLPAETVDTDVTRIVRRNYEMLLRSVATGRPPSAEDLAELTSSARNRADEEVPIADVLDAYHYGAQHWWSIVAELHEGGNGFAEGSLPQIGTMFFEWLRAATRAVIAGYDVDGAPAHDAPPTGHRELLDALVDGGDYAAVAHRFRLEVEPRYWAVAIAVDASDDETDARVSRSVATARKVRRLQRLLDGMSRGEAMHAITASGGLALVPLRPAARGKAEGSDDPQFAELRTRLAQLVDRMDAPTVCAVDLVTADEVAAVVPQLRDLLTIARRRSPRRSVVRFDDLAVEFQLSRPSRASRVSAARLAPIADDDVLWQTLEAYLDNDCSTAATAEVLHVHPNTVQYRLRKIAELTKLNLNRPGDVLTALGAVLAAGDRRSAAGDHPAE